MVIQNQTEYINKGLKQLSDHKLYREQSREQSQDLTESHKLLVRNKIQEMLESK